MAEVVTNAERCPIHNLDFDILWTIFEINANLHWTERRILNDSIENPPLPRALIVLRHTSQVCRRWREIVLGSPSLWGMVIELDLLIKEEEDYWTKEVMQRAGQSTLYVYGWVDAGSSPGPRTFLATLLNNSWERIRRFDVTVFRGQHLVPAMWDPLFRPSPNIEIIRLRVENGEGWYPKLRPDEEYQSPIFANTAPALREFSIKEVPVKWFSLHAPWLSQLHSLTLSTPHAFNATDVLVTLARIPALEKLQLKGILPPIKEQLTPVSLPHLHTLDIQKDFTTSFFLLKWITPAVGCALILDMWDYQFILDQDMHNFCKELTRYANNFFGCAPFPKCLVLEPGGKQFNVEGWRSSTQIRDSPSICADFSISIAGGRWNSTRLPALGPQKLTASLSACRFSIDTFHFRPTESLGFIPVQPSFTAFFLSLPSVENLVATLYGLRVLLDLQESSYDIIFPMLTTLRLSLQAVASDSSPIRTDPIFSFVKWRIEAGRPLTTLDVSEANFYPDLLDWTHLDEIEGLKVILKHNNKGFEEYICGTGSPERLMLRREF